MSGDVSRIITPSDVFSNTGVSVSECVGDLNKLVLKEINTGNAEENLEIAIAKLRRELLQKMEELASLRHSKGVENSRFTNESLVGLFTQHSSMHIGLDIDGVTVMMHRMPLEFHKKHGGIEGAENNCVLYHTLPVYSFAAMLGNDGKVSLRSEPAKMSLAVKESARNAWFINSVSGNMWGHPNATSGNNNSLHPCTGNNNFISDYDYMVRNKRLNGAAMSLLFGRIGTWFKSCNIDDMYDNYASPMCNIDNVVCSSKSRDIAELVLKKLVLIEKSDGGWESVNMRDLRLEVENFDCEMKLKGHLSGVIGNNSNITDVGYILKYAYGFWLLANMGTSFVHDTALFRSSLRNAIALDMAVISNDRHRVSRHIYDKDVDASVTTEGVFADIKEFAIYARNCGKQYLNYAL